MNNYEKARDFINDLAEKYSAGGYIFRGTVRRYSLERGYKGIRDGINSSLYRWVVKAKKEGDISEWQGDLKKIFSENKAFLPEDIEDDIVGKAYKHFPSDAKSHEILTDLQHFGGKTNLIDFTCSIYVAFLFACQKCPNKNGELIILQRKSFEKIDEIDYEKRSEKGALKIFVPTKNFNSGHRVQGQQSVFVRPTNGYINPDLCDDIIPIPAKLKEPISEYLLTFFNITIDNIYGDIHGFINNERNHETAFLYFFMALARKKDDDDENAIKFYLESIKRNRYFTAAYFNLGNVYFGLKNYKRAIENYSMVVSLNPNYADAFYNRALAKAEIGDDKGSREDFDEAKKIIYKLRGQK